MSFYRYSATCYNTDGTEETRRSLVPINPENEKNPYFCHRYYTGGKDDSPYFYVISCGHEKSSPLHKKSPRTVNRFIIHYVVSGKGYFNGKPVNAGQIFFCHPYEEHTISQSDTPMEFYYIGISGPNTEAVMKSSGFMSIPQICDFHFADKLPEIFGDALYSPHTEHDAEFYLLGIFFKLLALHKEENLRSSQNAEKLDTLAYYKQALAFVEDYLLDSITASDVANHLHISPSYLRAIFSKHCKFSLRELLIRKRIDCAAKHITLYDYSVTQAAALIGYDDYTLFSKIFKKYMGLSPQSYKKLRSTTSALPENINA